MPVILVATDFTEVAENAVHYACDMATDINAQVVLLHAYSIPIMFSDLPMPSPLIDTEKAVQANMDKLAERVRGKYPDLTISTSLIYGAVLDGIEDYTEKNGDPMLVIAGNSHSTDNPAWIDSALLEAVKNLRYPLLAIPMDTRYRPIHNICLAYDNKYTGSDVALVKLRELSAALKANLHVLVAETDPTKTHITDEVNEQAKTILSAADPEYRIIHGTDINEAIQDYCAQYQIDWLAMIPRKHSFFEGLFHKSHTKFMVNNAHIPLMALHES